MDHPVHNLLAILLSGFFFTIPISAESMHEVYPVFNISDHYIPSGIMGDFDAVKVIDGFSENVSSDEQYNSCTKITYLPTLSDRGNKWAGVYWLYPDSNWGDLPGYNLSGYSKLTFRAKGELGNEVTEFKFGGIKNEKKPYVDSLYPAITTKKVMLGSDWKDYSLNIKTNNLTNILGGFCWVATESDNPDGCTIYIDDIILK
jgi:hypothetical protein